jgi:hypothetical protein
MTFCIPQKMALQVHRQADEAHMIYLTTLMSASTIEMDWLKKVISRWNGTPCLTGSTIFSLHNLGGEGVFVLPSTDLQGRHNMS